MFKLSKQWMLDKVCEGIHTKSLSCYDLNVEVAAYQDSEGNKCAIGYALPDGILEDLIKRGYNTCSGIGTLQNVGIVDFEDRRTATTIQMCHDAMLRANSVNNERDFLHYEKILKRTVGYDKWLKKHETTPEQVAEPVI